MTSCSRLCLIFGFLGAMIAIVNGHWHLNIELNPTNVTGTPSVVTVPIYQSTSKRAYQSTVFPIWNGTTGSTTEPTTNSTTLGPTTGSTFTPTSPSTHTPTQNSTTAHPTKPTTSTQVTPTGGPVPTPTLPPEPIAPKEPWNFTYADGNNCIMASFAGRIEITYRNVLQNVVTTGVDVPENATINVKKSHCRKGEEEAALVLDISSPSAPKAALKVVFKQSPGNNDSSVFAILFTVRTTEDTFPGLESKYQGQLVTLSATNLTLYDTKPEYSYSCATPLKTSLTTVKVKRQDETEVKSKVPFQSGTFETSNLKLQAFLPSDHKTVSFFPNTSCKQDEGDISSTIPITVGLILLFMVGIVLIAYFIGRSRQQRNASI